MFFDCSLLLHLDTLQRCITVLAGFIIAVAMADCAPRPIPISIGNVTLTNNEDMRGVGLSLGNPPQNFAFLPQW